MALTCIGSVASARTLAAASRPDILRSALAGLAALVAASACLSCLPCARLPGMGASTPLVTAATVLATSSVFGVAAAGATLPAPRIASCLAAILAVRLAAFAWVFASVPWVVVLVPVLLVLFAFLVTIGSTGNRR